MVAFFAVTRAWIIDGSATLVADFSIAFETDVLVAGICMIEPEIRMI
jgi:hypothetical protein